MRSTSPKDSAIKWTEFRSDGAVVVGRFKDGDRRRQRRLFAVKAEWLCAAVGHVEVLDLWPVLQAGAGIQFVEAEASAIVGHGLQGMRLGVHPETRAA